MKQLFLSVAILSIMASCSQNEITEGVTTNQNPIGFSTLNSSVTRVANENGSNYTVYAQYSLASDYNSLNSSDWHIENCNINGNSNHIIGDEKYYWPTKALTFYAFAPSIPEGTDHIDVVAKKPDFNKKGTLDITYTVPTGAKEDFTVAKHASQAYDGTTQTVPFQFNHMLSKINIKAAFSEDIHAESDYTLVLSDPLIKPRVSFKPLYNKGTIDLITSEALIVVKEKVTDLEYAEEIKISNKHETETISYYIMPHDANAGTIVEITGLAYQKKDDATTKKDITLTHTFSTEQGTPPGGTDKITNLFRANYQYSINFTIKLEGIQFDSKPSKWTDITVSL